MNFAVAATVLALVAVAELPDKTMIADIIMGSRGRPGAVWVGSTGAMAIHTAVAVIAGRFLQLLPHRALETVIAVGFGLGALYLLFVPDKLERSRGEAEGARAAVALENAPAWRIAAGAFGVILIAEFGDLTQLLLVNLEARYKAPVSVFAGGFLAFAAVGAIAVLSGRTLLRVLPLWVIRRAGGVALLGFCAYSIYTLA